MLSYAHGSGDHPLLGETIGDNFERTVARVPDSDALVSCHQGLRYTYAELGEAVDRLASGLLAAGLQKGDRLGVWSPNRAEWVLTQYATAKLGVILVNINPAYRLHELEFALRHSGCRWLIAAPECKGSDFVAMTDQVRGALPELERAVFFGTPEWEELAGADANPRELGARTAQLDFDDPINIQYTSGTTGFPKGATLSHHNILNNGYFVGRHAALHRGRPGLHPGAALPLLRDGDGQPRRRRSTAPAWSIRPRPSTPRRRSPPARRSAARASTACRRCSSPSSDTRGFEEFDLGPLRTGIMAGSPCPDRGDEARLDRHGDRPDDDRLRDDRDLAGLDPGPHRRHARAPLRDRRAGHAPHRDQDRRPRDRAHRSRAARRASSWLAATASCSATGTIPSAPRGDRRSPLDAHRRPGHDGRGRLRADRRADQGHDHPRRRERLPARDRGVPLHPPRRGRRAGDRRARRALRRGADGLDHPARRSRRRARTRSASSAAARSPTSRSRATSSSSTSSR